MRCGKRCGKSAEYTSAAHVTEAEHVTEMYARPTCFRYPLKPGRINGSLCFPAGARAAAKGGRWPVKYRRHPLRRQRWVIQRPSPEGDGVYYWSESGVWVQLDERGQPDLYSPAPSIYTTKPSAVQITGYANAVAVKLERD
jgi:hypothetical protein